MLVQSSKRILRSNEIILPQSGLLDTDLDLSFSLQVCLNTALLYCLHNNRMLKAAVTIYSVIFNAGLFVK